LKVIADTNVLLRVLVPDDPAQQSLAKEALTRAEAVVIGVHALCELTWVMERSYGIHKPDVAAAIRMLMTTRNVVMNRPTVEAGLRMLDAGGDFADGVIAFDGLWLGGETFVSFDRKAVRLLGEQGQQAALLAP
jgi:predicted nucleic-acid-binding protein